METKRLKVLMVGPDRSVHGGISGVVNHYYEAGLNNLVDLCYIGTMVEGTKGRKLVQAVKAYFQFLYRLPSYGIVHVNMASDASYYRKSFFVRTAKLFRKKIVIHQHGGDFPGFYEKELGERGRKSVKKVLAMGDAFLVLGTAWKGFFGTIIDRSRITVLPDGIQVPDCGEKQYGVHKILFLGRLCKEKGIGELLAVMPRLQEQYPDVRLYLAGIWETVSLREQAEALGECVVDLGWIDGTEKQRYLQECDIFVMPSYFEGQSVAILEAMANRCAVVASETGGIPDMIVEEETGLFAKPGDEATLAQGLLRLLGDAGLCQELGQKAREKVQAEFAIENHIERLLGIYRGL